MAIEEYLIIHKSFVKKLHENHRIQSIVYFLIFYLWNIDIASANLKIIQIDSPFQRRMYKVPDFLSSLNN